MKKKVSFLLCSLFIALKLLVLTGCAGIVPPSGGPKDTIPPRLVLALPADSATNVKIPKFVLTFDEYIDMTDPAQNVMISPSPKKSPLIDHNLKKITVKFRDSLEDNTTYSIDFGNSIKDINEGNVLRNFTYVFSTGTKIADGGFEGKVILAETGKTDSTLLVILHRNLNDTAIYKSTPRYIAKINGKGEFVFRYLEPGKYNAFVLPNEYLKMYDDSTKTFAFLDGTITISNATKPVVFYAYQEFKKKDKTSSASNISKSNTKKEEKFIKFTTSLISGHQQDLLSNLQINFSKRLQLLDSSKIILCDTDYNPIAGVKIGLDTSKTIASIGFNWKETTDFRLIIAKDAAKDTSGNILLKGDTLKFNTAKESEYGSMTLKFSNLDFSKHPVLQIISNDKLQESVPLEGNIFKRKLYWPGDYMVRILYDANKNGVWDAGNYKNRQQPEIVLDKNWKVNIKANWDNETEIKL